MAVPARKRVLYVSASIGLGHVTRDVAIAGELRRMVPGLEIDWLAAPPATEYLRAAGETLLPEAASYADVTAQAEKMAKLGGLNVTLFALKVRKQWEANARLTLDIVKRGGYDLVVGDETYDLIIALADDPTLIGSTRLAILYDWVGLDRVGWHPLEILGVTLFNRKMAKPPTAFTAIFLGELDDVPDEPFGPFLPSRRAFTEDYFKVVGYPLHFDPAAYADRRGLKRVLGYGEEEPLVLASIGGTAVGKELLERCAEAFPLLQERVPELRMVLVCGPRLPVDSVIAPPGVEVRGYVPDLYRHLAACDVAVVQGGGTTTLELTALKRPFLYFPLEKHFEQLADVAPRCQRHRAGEMHLLRQTPSALMAERVLSLLDREVDYLDIRTDGATKAAEVIAELL